MPRLILEQAFHRFSGRRHPIVNIRDAPLDWFGIATLEGPSGSGKTTLFRVLSAWYDTKETLCSFNPSINRYREVRFIGAQDSLFPWRSALGNLRYYGIGRDRAIQELEALGLTAGVTLPVTNLSYGMYKRVELAIAVAAVPELLLLDEFFSSMDDAIKARVLEYLKQRRGDRRTWVIAHEEPLRRWLTTTQYSLTIDQERQCVTGFSRVS